MMKKTISNKFAYLYLFLTIGMVMYHSRSLYGYNINYLGNLDNKILSLYTDFATHIGGVCMVFFFFASAFWFYRNINSKKELFDKCKKRLKTLLIPFMAWTVIIGIYQLIMHQITINFNNIFYHLFLTPIAGPLWYILGILMLQLLSPIIFYIKKNKLVTSIIFILITVYVFLRTFGVIPQLLTFENWWWYNNLISYIPIYLIGAYVGIYYNDLLLIKEYDERRYTYIGIILLIISLTLWKYVNIKGLLMVYFFIEIIAIWFILKPKFCEKEIREFFKSNFYIFALHNPILIPITNSIMFKYIFKGITLIGTVTVIVKIVQLCIIILISCSIRFIIVKLIPKLDKYLTGGR